MAAMSDYLENKLTDHIFRAQTFTAPANLYFALFTAAPSDSGGGTEVAGGSYARVAMATSLTNWSGTQSAGSTTASSGTGGASSNNIALTFPAPTADWGTVTHFGIFDAASSGNLLFHGALAASAVISNGGPAPSFSADTLSVTFA